MAKFFVNPENVKENEIFITGSDVKHIKNVLRLSEGKEITINDGQGHDYQCIIKQIDRDVISTEIVERKESNSEPPVETVLFQSLIKGEKMEFVIQKSIEIGVTTIIPLITDRCVVKLETQKKQQSKLERWQKIAESAAKQSKRGIIPQVLAPLTYKEAIAYACENLEKSCIPFENEHSHHLKGFLKGEISKSIGIFIGPEGGFTDEEVEYAMQHNVSPVTLGKRILRSETAGLVTLANIMYEVEGIEDGGCKLSNC